MAKSENQPAQGSAETESDHQWTVRSATSEDLHTARFLGRHYFGGDRDDGKQYVYRSTTRSDQPHGHAIVAEVKGVTVGVSVLHMKRPGAMHHLLDVPELLPYEIRGCLEIPTGGFNGPATGLGWIQLIAVDKTWWGNGIATHLLKELVRWAEASRIRTLAGLSWQREGTPDSTGVFEHNGFDCIAEYDTFYAEKDDRAFCPDCGEECKCAGRIYVRDLGPVVDQQTEPR